MAMVGTCPARTWKALLSQSTEQEVMSPMRCRFPEMRLVSVSQQPNTSYGLLRTRDSRAKVSAGEMGSRVSREGWARGRTVVRAAPLHAHPG